MLDEHLALRGVDREAYFRLNVEVGVGDFGMNEWARLADISTSTRRYLARSEVQTMSLSAAARLARIYLNKLRSDPNVPPPPPRDPRRQTLQNVPEASYPTFAAELPADVPPQHMLTPSRLSYDMGATDNLALPVRHSPRTSEESRRPSSNPSPLSGSPMTAGADRFTAHAPTPSQYWTAGGMDKIAIVSEDEEPGPPPLPPKTPIDGRRPERVRPLSGVGFGGGGMGPPYPLDDGPPPVVNMARKPEWNGR